MTARVRINGRDVDHVDAGDRGLRYGDGLFETMRRVGGVLPLWPRHMARLAEGCRRLAMPAPDPAWLAQECERACRDQSDAVVRLSVTRGAGPRGYAPPEAAAATCIVQAGAAPAVRRDWYHHGVQVHLCDLRLAHQPRLAGIKHLNRLEQVLARSEWHNEELAEGLVCDGDDGVISATAANLFAVFGHELATPAVDRCGVAGVARAEVLARRPDTRVRRIALRDLAMADELFLTSSVRGILPVAGIPAWRRRYAVGPVCRDLQRQWQAAGFVPEAAP